MATGLTLAARAFDYPYLTFQTSGGALTSVPVTSLVMTVGDGQLVVTNSDLSQIYVLTDLSKMYFSTSAAPTGLRPVTVPDVDGSAGSVEVYTAAGVAMGRYGSMDEARHSLRPGIYVVKSGLGVRKIVVR